MSAGEDQPVGWACQWSTEDIPDFEFAHSNQAVAEDMLADSVCGGRVVPLYLRPQLILTAKEREAVKWAATAEWGTNPHAATLHGLLERTGGER